jgi:hypothetical protein
MAFLLRSRALELRTLFAIVSVSTVGSFASAALIVNPALPITQRVDVQIIQTSLDGGLLPATVLGNATQQATIEAGIDKIWAQAGIDIEFLPTITPYANTFAYKGSLAPRPSSDLGAILSNATSAGKLNPDPNVLNMFFVEVAPGYGVLNQNTAAGIAMIGNNGMALYTGESLLTFANGRDVIAGVVAHEIGHNLGLTHTASGGANLMAPSGTTEQLTSQQIATVLGSRFVQDAAAAGDFTGDGIVNAADLTVWRGAYGVNANGDADGDNDTDGRDFLLWQKTYGSGALAALETVPEPTSLVLALVAGIAVASATFRHRGHTERAPHSACGCNLDPSVA